MIKILGISAFYHDSAAALIIDGKIIAAAQEERFSRKKHDSRYPFNAIEFVLRYAKVKLSEVDHIVFFEKPPTQRSEIEQASMCTEVKSTFKQLQNSFQNGSHVGSSLRIFVT